MGDFFTSLGYVIELSIRRMATWNLLEFFLAAFSLNLLESSIGLKNIRIIKKFENTYLCNRVLILISVSGFGGNMAIILPRSGNILTLESRFIFRTITLSSLSSSMPIEIICVDFCRSTKFSSARTLARAL